MEIIEIKKAEISILKGLWEELNSHHGEKSSHFKFYFKSFTFEKRIEKLLTKEHLVIYAAEINSDLVGYCIATVNGNLGEVDSIFVKKEHRGNISCSPHTLRGDRQHCFSRRYDTEVSKSQKNERWNAIFACVGNMPNRMGNLL